MPRRRRLVAVAVAVAVAVVVGLVTATGCGDEDAPAADPTVPEAPSPTPPPEAPGPGFHELTLASGGEQRDYLLDAPERYDPAGDPIPLIVALHAGRSSAETIRAKSHLDEFVQEQGVLVVYPQGDRGWWRPPLDGEHGVAVEWAGDPVDVDFLRDLVEHLVAEWNVAPGQVYATGHSNGAAMSYRLAVEASEVFAAVAPVGGYIIDPPDAIDPPEPVSVIGFVGGSSKYTEEIAEGMQIWRDLLDCEPGDPSDEGDEGDGITRTEASCRNGSEVVQYDLEDMGHTWPREASYGLEANQVMWEFFAAHARD